MSNSKYNFPHTDFNYVFLDFEADNRPSLTAIKDLISLHESDSRSVPFFVDADADKISKSLPINWEIETFSSNPIPEKSIRIIVYNAYYKAKRNISQSVKSVKLVANAIGGNFFIIEKIEVDGLDEYTDFLNLEGAFGKSPIMVLVASGIAFQSKFCEFEINRLQDAVNYIKQLKLDVRYY